MVQICKNVPVIGHMVKGEDGNFHLDPERSTFADIPADDIARFLIERFGLTPAGREAG